MRVSRFCQTTTTEERADMKFVCTLARFINTYSWDGKSMFLHYYYYRFLVEDCQGFIG